LQRKTVLRFVIDIQVLITEKRLHSDLATQCTRTDMTSTGTHYCPYTCSRSTTVVIIRIFMSAHLAAWKVVDVPGMFTVNSLLLGVCPLAVVFTGVRVCLASWLAAGDSLLMQVFLQQPLPEGWQWEARAMMPGIQILPVVTLHHLSSKRTRIMSLLHLVTTLTGQ